MTRRSKLTSLALQALLLVATGLASLDAGPAHAEAELVREARDVGVFHSVRFEGSGHVSILLGREFGVSVETTARAMPKVVTTVKGEVLHITRRRGGRAPLNVEVGLPVLTGLALHGSAEVSVKGGINTPEFRLHSQGSSHTTIERLNVQSFDASYKGSGHLVASGSTQQMSVKSSGSTDFELAGLEASEATVSISGRGRMTLNVRSRLEGQIKGSGEIVLIGAPEHLNVGTSGSGRIIQGPVEDASPTADEEPAG
jgi:hypothetical protein